MSAHLFNDVQTLKTQIADLIAQGTTPEILSNTQGEWARVRRAVHDVCARVTAADPQTAHALLDDIGDMIRALEVIDAVYNLSASIQKQQ